jgi:putative transposase
MELTMGAIYDEEKGRYGYRRVPAALYRAMAEPVSHQCVQRLMQRMGLRGLIRTTKRFQPVPGMNDVHVPNVLQRCQSGPLRLLLCCVP